MLGMLGAAARARGEHGRHGGGRAWGSSTASGSCCPGRWRWRPRPAWSRGCSGGGRSRPPSPWRRCCSRCAPSRISGASRPAGWSSLAIAATVVALIREPRRDIDRGPWWAASLLIAATLVAPIQHSGGTVLDEARAGPHRPPRADLAVGLTPGVAVWFRRARPAAPGGDGRGAPAVRAGRRGARLRRRPARGADAGGAEDRHGRPAPGLSSASSTRRRLSRSGSTCSAAGT